MGWSNGEWYDDGATFVHVRDWCPECDPEGVPEPYTLRLCGAHTPSVDGADDVTARGQSGAYWSSGAADVDGVSNAEWCRMIHRQRN